MPRRVGEQRLEESVDEGFVVRWISRYVHDSLDRVAAAQFLSSLETYRPLANGRCIVRNAPQQGTQRPAPHQVTVIEPTAHIASQLDPISCLPSRYCRAGVFGYSIDDQQRSDFAPQRAQFIHHCERDDCSDAVTADQQGPRRLKSIQRIRVVVGNGIHGVAKFGVGHLLWGRLDSIKADSGFKMPRQVEKIRARDPRCGVNAIESRARRA